MSFGKLINEKAIKDISHINKIKVQVGGGVRSLEHIEKLLDFGVDKVILGPAAVENIKLLEAASNKYNTKIALSIDVRLGCIALSGWKNQTKILASDFVKKNENLNISRIIYTDINRDGTKTGPNLEETINFSKLTKIPVIVSGGMSSIEDVINIKNKKTENIGGVIIGKAIYDGSINIKKLSKII